MTIPSSFSVAESQYVNNMLSKIDSDISELEALRIQYRRRKNELDAYTSVLPTEALCAIFEVVCGFPEGSSYQHVCYPLVLSSVCYRWHNIVYDTPSLWQRLDLRLYHIFKTSRMSLALLRSYIPRLKALPLSLRVSCNQTTRHRHLSRADVAPVDELFRVILEECPEKLGSLIFDQVPRGWWPLLFIIPTSTKLPCLERLALSWSEKYKDPPIEPFQKNMVPQLKSVSLSGERLPIKLPWNQITILELKNMIVGQCLELLLDCPLLVEFHCRDTMLTTGEDRRGYYVIREDMVFPHMKHVSWQFGLVAWDIVLMEGTQFPNLRSISWCKHSYTSPFLHTADKVEGGSYQSLRLQFTSRLQSLTVFEGSLSLWTIEELCKTLPRTLEELYLTDGDGAATLDTFHLLTLHDDKPDTNIFPNLRILSTPFLSPPQPNDCNAATVALKMLQSRREGPPEKWEQYQRLRRIRLKCPVPIRFTGWEVHLDELRQLVEGGLEFEEEERRFEVATTSIASRVGNNTVQEQEPLD